MSTEIEKVTLAVTTMNKVESGLAALREQYQGVIFKVTTTAGMGAAKKARGEIREPRFEVERIRKAAKAPILALGKQLDSTAARITAELEKIEGPIHAQIVAEEQREELEKEQRIAAEFARVEGIHRRIEQIRSMPVHAATADSLLIGQMLQKANATVIEETEYQEFTSQATEALTVSRAALSHLLTERKAHEAAQEQLRRDQEELAKLRAENAAREAREAQERARAESERQAERERIAAQEKAEREAQERLDREARAKADAEAKALRDAEAEKLRLEREAIAREVAENRRKEAERRAEVDRQEAEAKAAQTAEAERLAAQQAEIERQQEALRAAQAPKPKPRKAPGGQEIAQVIAAHFSVDVQTAITWLTRINWEREKYQGGALELSGEGDPSGL